LQLSRTFPLQLIFTVTVNLGVDGNNDPYFYRRFYAVANGETSPWWAVDLGSPMDVYGVDFTNRGDAFGMIDWFYGRFSLLILSFYKTLPSGQLQSLLKDQSNRTTRSFDIITQ